MRKSLTRAPYIAQLRLRRWMLGRCHRIKKLLTVNDPSDTFSHLESPEKILVVICGLIGDSVMCTPVVEEARRIWPRAKVTILGRQHNCTLLQGLPCVDEFRETTANPFGFRNRGQSAMLRRWLTSSRFDIAILLLGEDFAPLLAKAKIPVRVGPKQMPLAPCMTHIFDNATPRTWGPNEKLNSLRVLGFDVKDRSPRLAVPEVSRASARDKLLALGIKAEVPYAVIHPFGSEEVRWWPMDFVGMLSDAFSSRMGLYSVLVGGPEIRTPIRVPGSGRLVNAVGSFTLQELSAVLADCTIAVTTDSGPFHMAGALERPTVGLFRACRPEHAQRYPCAKVVLGRAGECETACRWDRCRSYPCRQMRNISAAQVLDEVEKLL